MTCYIAVAAVLSNWHNVLRAINMASGEFHECPIESHGPCSNLFFSTAKLPKPQDPDERHDENEEAKKESGVPLPQTLVRIPTQQQSLQPQSSTGAHEE
jgi:DASH complex subunit DAD2